MEAMEKGDNPLHAILEPIYRLNTAALDMTSNPENLALFMADAKSKSVLEAVQRLNSDIMHVLDDEHKHSEPHSNDHKHSEPHSNDQRSPPKIRGDDDEYKMSLPEVIGCLVDVGFVYDRELMVSSLSSANITRSNYSAKDKGALTAILKQCGFGGQKALWMVEQIESNISPQSLSNGHRNGSVHRATPSEEVADSMGLKPVDLTVMAMEEVLSGQSTFKAVDREEIRRVYKANGVDSLKLMTMTEEAFVAILKHYGSGKLGTTQSIKIHRAIKTLLNAPEGTRHDIDIAKAIDHLINERGIVISKNNGGGAPRRIEVDSDTLREALSGWTVEKVLSGGKRQFGKDMAAAIEGFKRGHATKIYVPLMAFIRDQNVKVPPHILIPREDSGSAPEKGVDTDCKEGQ